MNCRPSFFALFLLGTFFCFSCEARPPAGPQAGLEERTLTIEKRGGGSVSLKAEIARTGEQRSRGLMFRASLEDGRGMLFIFDQDEVLSFWMKDTLIPLSIAFITYEGKILDIRDMRPGDLRSITSSRSVRYALEVPRGWFGRAGIETGDRVGGF
ncbi:MAG: DUF192 domain-containing protein [Treponema sp.]|jgi:uncharacterized membrane protein (UPF0127 family)|nr:DUF192 domain-containing protein [Treponema sp.]